MRARVRACVYAHAHLGVSGVEVAVLNDVVEEVIGKRLRLLHVVLRQREGPLQLFRLVCVGNRDARAQRGDRAGWWGWSVGDEEGKERGKERGRAGPQGW